MNDGRYGSTLASFTQHSAFGCVLGYRLSRAYGAAEAALSDFQHDLAVVLALQQEAVRFAGLSHR